ncbi:MAG: hypothetical protein U0Y68_17595 [Blastocatellia bacterium]
MGVLALSLNTIFYLITTGLLSWIVGFFLGRIFGSANASELLKERERWLRVREQDYNVLQGEVATMRATVQELQVEQLALQTTIETQSQQLAEWQARHQEAQADLDARISELDELKAETDQERAALQTQVQTLQTTAQQETEALKIRVAEAEGALKLSAHHEKELRTQIKAKDNELAQLKVRVTELEMMARDVKMPAVKAAPASSQPPTAPEPDDLKKVYGIGPRLEKLLNRHGVYRFRQIAEWSGEDVQRYDRLLEQFRGRIEREGWVASAKEQHLKKYGEQL